MPWIGHCGKYRLKEDTQGEKAGHVQNDIELRNLAKHTGVISDTKKLKALKNYEDEIEDFEEETYGVQPYNLKFGYSSSLSVLAYLVRMEPYTSNFIEQNGKLDDPNRMFSDVREEWSKVCQSTQCNNEISPEWFYLPRLFQNKNCAGFGIKNNRDTVDNVVIPSRYGGKYHEYCMNLRRALRDYRHSKNLNIWLDMLFGNKQQSKNQANIFFEFAHEKYYEKLEDKYAVSRDSLKSVFDFFQLPTKVFSRSHADPRDWICNQSYFKTRDDPNLSKMIKAEYKEVLKNSESIHFKQIEQLAKLKSDRSIEDKLKVASKTYMAHYIQSISIQEGNVNKEYYVFAGFQSGCFALVEKNTGDKITSYFFSLPCISGTIADLSCLNASGVYSDNSAPTEIVLAINSHAGRLGKSQQGVL